jgi:peptide/nickel transport system substrate-binding protein
VDRRGFLAGSVAASLVACGRREADRLEISIAAVSQELDPYTAANLETAELSWLYADGLAGAAVSSPASGGLCVSAPVRSIVAGKTSYLYELRGGVRWHDAKPMVAQDVADCFQRLSAGTWAHQRPFSLVRHINILDDRRFEVVCEQDDPEFPRSFFTPTGAPGVPLVRAGRIPIGTGPLRPTDRGPDTWTFERWEGSPRGTPAVSRARLSYLADDRTQQVMIASGESDVALFVDGRFLRDRGIPYFRRLSGVAYAIVNVVGSLDTAASREAFAAAVDRQEIVRKIYGGMTSAYNSVVAPFVPGSNVRVAHGYDPVFARRVFGQKKPSHLDIAVTDGSSERIGLLMQAHLALVGVKSSVRKYPVQVFLAAEGPLRSGKFDVALFGEYFSLDPDLTATWGCDARPPNGGNFSRLCDAQLDGFARAGDMRLALEALAHQAAVVPLVESAQYVGLSKRVRGAENAADFVPTVFGCAGWSLE